MCAHGGSQGERVTKVLIVGWSYIESIHGRVARMQSDQPNPHHGEMMWDALREGKEMLSTKSELSFRNKADQIVVLATCNIWLGSDGDVWYGGWDVLLPVGETVPDSAFAPLVSDIQDFARILGREAHISDIIEEMKSSLDSGTTPENLQRGARLAYLIWGPEGIR